MEKVEVGAKEAEADSKWEDIVEILQTAAGEFYAQGPRREQIDGYKELITARETTLRQRAKARARLVQLGTGKEECDEERRKAEQDAIAWRLKELTRRAQGIRRRWEKMKRATLLEELQEAARSGRMAVADKIFRLLSGKSGPKNRSRRTVRSGEANWGSPGPVAAWERFRAALPKN